MSEPIRANPPPPPRRPPASAPTPPGTARARELATGWRSPTDRDARIDADADLMTQDLQSLATAFTVREQFSGDAQDEGDQEQQQHQQAEAARAADLHEAQVNHRLARVGQFVTHVYSVSHDQGSWSLSLQLDDDLLPSTTLHLGYAPTRMTLHFDTLDWGVRELLHGRMPAMEQLVRQMLPPECDVVVGLT